MKFLFPPSQASWILRLRPVTLCVSYVLTLLTGLAPEVAELSAAVTGPEIPPERGFPSHYYNRGVRSGSFVLVFFVLVLVF